MWHREKVFSRIAGKFGKEKICRITAVLQNLAKNSNVNFSACVKFHVENEWEISRMCEIDV